MMSLREEMNLNMSLPDRIKLVGHTPATCATAKICLIVSEKTAGGTQKARPASLSGVPILQPLKR
jgi:hypothetical protein